MIIYCKLTIFAHLNTTMQIESILKLVPSIVPTMVEARVLSSRSTKLQWTVAYSPEHELIEGFFVGYRSFDSSTSSSTSNNINNSIQRSDIANIANDNNKHAYLPQESPGKSTTFTYKTIRLSPEALGDWSQRNNLATRTSATISSSTSSSDILLTPIASVSKTVPATSSQNFAHIQGVSSGQNNGANIVLVQTFELLILGLDRDTEYTTMIQCFNSKGAGPTSDPVLFRTFANGEFLKSPFDGSFFPIC